MKKFWIVFVAILLLVVGCGKKEKKEDNNYSYGREEDGLVISYQDTQSGVENPVTFNIQLYNNQKMTLSYSNEDGFKDIILTDVQYEEILNLAFQDSFLQLKSGDIGEQVEGGSYERLSLYYSNKSLILSGSNISNQTFRQIVNKLKQYDE